MSASRLLPQPQESSKSRARVLAATAAAVLHNRNNLGQETVLDEKGNVAKGCGDNPNEHDILTGSRADGTAFAPQADTTCKAWTSSSDGSAIVGHHNRNGPLPENGAKSWNFPHPSAGCSQEALGRTGGSGRLYCFAANRAPGDPAGPRATWPSRPSAA